MEATQRKYRQPSPAVVDRLYQERTEILGAIEARVDSIGASGNEMVRQELRCRIRDRNYLGEFLPMVCDHCYSELWQDKETKVVSCPGCGWVVTAHK